MMQGSVVHTLVSREELYRLVWNQPMIHVAAKFGISGTWLSKACRKLHVPYPPRGYWAKFAVGKAPPAIALPAPAPGTPLEVTICPSAEAARVAPSRAAFEAALARDSEIAVPTRLVRPHLVIARRRGEKKRRQELARHERDPWRRDFLHEPAFTELDRRQHRLLHALFSALEEDGGKVVESRRSELAYERDGERVEFGVREKLKQEKRPLDAREKRWQRPGDKDWRQELVPTGKLVFGFKTWLQDGLKREWLETDSVPMETLLPAIVATFRVAIPWLAERRRQREEQALRWQEADHCRRAAERARLVNEARWRKFVEVAGAVRETDTARALLNRLLLVADTTDELASRWIAWAKAELAARDPLSGTASDVFQLLERADTLGTG